MPRGVRRSISSMTAAWRKAANFRRATSRLLSRSVTSRSIMRPSRTSKVSAGGIGLALLIVEGLGHAGKPEGGEAFMGVVDEHEVSFWLVSGSSRGRGCCRDGWDRRPVRDRA